MGIEGKTAQRHELDVRYQLCRCQFFNEYVWAIRTKQPDGSWKIVNCLDKHEPCFSVPCAFTSDQGEWPFRAPRTPINTVP
jgi:hypothetical protein